MSDSLSDRHFQPSIGNIDSQLNILIEQIGRLTQGLIKIKLTAQAQAESISVFVALANRQASVIERLLERER